MGGSGCTVTDCRSLVVVEDCDQFSGAISGRDLGVFRGNYFVSDVLRGIDRRSLSGQAEPRDFAAVWALGGVDAETGKWGIASGANVLVAGSSVYKAEDIPARIRALRG